MNLWRALSKLAVAAAILALAVVGPAGGSALAYSWTTCSGNAIVWNSGWTAMYISTTSFPAGSSWDTRLQNAMWHWNNVKGSDWTFYVGRDTDGTHNNSNGRNEVYLESGLGSSTLAVTYTRYHCYWLFGYWYGIDETDIGFNVSKSWNTGDYSYSTPTGSPYCFEGVALHELGHALGLLHSDGAMATMNSYYPNSGPFGYYKEWDPFADDRQGVRYLYSDSTSEIDVAGSPLERSGSGTSNLVESSTWAYAGGTVSVEFTFSNLSTSTQSFNIGFYLSTNDYISTWDTLLGVNYGAWGTAGYTGTFTRTLTIPSGTAPGTYYLGFLIDYDGALSEANETNNNQPMPRTITIY
jgi:hypothetical protein